MDILQLGRAAAALTSPRGGGKSNYGRWPRYEANYVPAKPPFTDEEAAELLHVTVRELTEAKEAWREKNSPLTQDKRRELIFEFLRKEGRWPRRADCKRKNGFISETDFRYHFTADLQHICKKKRLKPHEVLSIPNQTIRRQQIEKYGVEKLITAAGTLIQQDDCGKLWETEGWDVNVTAKDRVARYVEVVNSTPEPDGTYSHYFLRVPPETRTARAAVEWTFSWGERMGERRGNLKFAAQT